MNNPLLQPIYGISLQDFAAAIYFQTEGADMHKLLDILGISPIVWNEVSALWTKRMEEDASFTVITFYSRYYNEAEKHPKFSCSLI